MGLLTGGLFLFELHSEASVKKGQVDASPTRHFKEFPSYGFLFPVFRRLRLSGLPSTC